MLISNVIKLQPRLFLSLLSSSFFQENKMGEETSHLVFFPFFFVCDWNMKVLFLSFSGKIFEIWSGKHLLVTSRIRSRFPPHTNAGKTIYEKTRNQGILESSSRVVSHGAYRDVMGQAENFNQGLVVDFDLFLFCFFVESRTIFNNDSNRKGRDCNFDTGFLFCYKRTWCVQHNIVFSKCDKIKICHKVRNRDDFLVCPTRFSSFFPFE